MYLYCQNHVSRIIHPNKGSQMHVQKHSKKFASKVNLSCFISMIRICRLHLKNSRATKNTTPLSPCRLYTRIRVAVSLRRAYFNGEASYRCKVGWAKSFNDSHTVCLTIKSSWPKLSGNIICELVIGKARWERLLHASPRVHTLQNVGQVKILLYIYPADGSFV